MGVAWTYRDTAKVIAEAGYKYMHFDDNGTIKDTSKSKSSMTGHLRAEYGFTPDWTTGFDIAYAPAYGAVTSNSSDSNYIERLTSGLFLTYSPGEGRFKFEATPYFSHNAPSENVNYKEYGLGLGVSYVVTDWVQRQCGIQVQRNGLCRSVQLRSQPDHAWRGIDVLIGIVSLRRGKPTTKAFPVLGCVSAPVEKEGFSCLVL